MNLLVTSGNTAVPIDQVRVISNVFTGRTGAVIALRAQELGHAVTLLSSHPEVVASLRPEGDEVLQKWRLLPYHTFDELQQHMESALRSGQFDAVIHSAAVSDYLASGVYGPEPGTNFEMTAQGGLWRGEPPLMRDRAAGKVKSDEPELWIRLTRAPKLIDLIRRDWGFRGVIVKFKLEVGVTDEQLLDIAERSRRHSDANLMVANTLEGSRSHAFLGPLDERYQRVTRAELADALLAAIERVQHDNHAR